MMVDPHVATCLQLHATQKTDIQATFHKANMKVLCLLYRSVPDVGNVQSDQSAKPPTLYDLMYEVPWLLGILPPESWSAVSGCSRQLRHHIHSMTSTIIVTGAADLPSIYQGHWPQLGSIVLCNRQLRPHLHSLQDPRLLAAIGLNSIKFNCKPGSVLLLVNQSSMQPHQPVSSQAQHSAFQRLHQSEFANIQALILKHSRLNTDGIVQLSKPDWSALQHLDVSDNRLRGSAVACLAKGSWPELRHLDVSKCDLDTAAIAELVKGKWPKLDELRLSANPLLDAAAMSLLSTADWPQVRTLELRCTTLSADTIRALLRIRWRFGVVDLRWSALDAAAVWELSRATVMHVDLQNIGILDLSGNDLGADALAALAAASLGQLTGLYLSENKLDAVAASHLSSADLPWLEFLDLSDNELDSLAMRHLAQGQWEVLCSLSVFTNAVNTSGVRFLMEGQWSELEDLTLDASLANAVTWNLLDLALECLPNDAEMVGCDFVHFPRRLVKQCWPKLTEVGFVDRKTTRTITGSRSHYKYDPSDSTD